MHTRYVLKDKQCRDLIIRSLMRRERRFVRYYDMRECAPCAPQQTSVIFIVTSCVGVIIIVVWFAAHMKFSASIASYSCCMTMGNCRNVALPLRSTATTGHCGIGSVIRLGTVTILHCPNCTGTAAALWHDLALPILGTAANFCLATNLHYHNENRMCH